VGEAGLTLQRTIKKTILVLLVFMIAIPVIGCSHNRNDAYLSLFDEVVKTWAGPSEGILTGLDTKILAGAINDLFGQKYGDYTASPHLQSSEIKRKNVNAIHEWIHKASAISDIKDKGLRESRNYLLLALKSDDLLYAEFDQLAFQQMMSDEKLPAEYVQQKIQEIAAMGSTSQEAYDKAAQLVQDYKKKHKS